MNGKTERPDGSSLIAALPPDLSRMVLERAERVALPPGKVISDPEQHVDTVYFPITAVLSVLSIMMDGSGVETGVIGHEGMAPLAAFHGVDSASEQVMVQVPGDAWRMSRADFDDLVARSPELRGALHRFSQALFSFAAQTSGCNRKHSVVQRCARWLLVTHDRVPGDEFFLTHLFLAQMLGVRRSSVTIAAEALRAAGAITYSRGKVRIVDRDTLLTRSCNCYPVIRATYDRLMAGVPTPNPLARLTLSRDDMPLAHDGHDGSPFSFHDALEPEASNGAGDTRLEDVSMALEALEVAQEELRTQVEALEAVRDSMESQHEQWRSRFDALPDAFIETDGSDRIIEINRAGERLLGSSRASLIGKLLATLIVAEDRRGLRDVISRLRTSGEDGRWNGAVVDGRDHSPVDVTVTVTRGGGDKPRTALAIARQRQGKFAGARWVMRRDHRADPHS